MNTTQIKCFLALADTLNYTRAAMRLYMSQPSLSRQIVSMEKELNTQLVIRDQKQVRLTPAGMLLASELGGIQAATDSLIERVQTVGQGYAGTLSVGVLEGQWVGAGLTRLLRGFLETYPNTDLRICQDSFGGLRGKLLSGKLDVAVTLHFDVEGLEGVSCRKCGDDRAVLAVSRRLPLGQKEHITMDDMLEETLLVISPEDSRAGAEMLLSEMKERGFPTWNVRYAPNLTTVMLWIEAGLGVGLINHRSSLAANPEVRLIEELPLGDASPCVAWRKDNLNPAIPLLLERLKEDSGQ